MVSHSRNVSMKGSNLPKNPLFRDPICDQATGHGKHSAMPRLFSPLVDIPQMCLTWVTFAEGCTIFQLSTSERLPLPRYQQWRNLDAYIFSNILARGATIGSPICTGTLLQGTFL